jgi:hypothetical protein
VIVPIFNYEERYIKGCKCRVVGLFWSKIKDTTEKSMKHRKINGKKMMYN